MGRDLVLYPTQLTEDEFLASNRDRDVLCFTKLWCDRACGEFLRQCGIYDCWEDEDDPGVAIITHDVPKNKHVLLPQLDGYLTGDDLTDRLRPLQYCLAEEFQKVNPDRCDNSWANISALAYCLALPPKQVIIVYLA